MTQDQGLFAHQVNIFRPTYKKTNTTLSCVDLHWYTDSETVGHYFSFRTRSGFLCFVCIKKAFKELL